MRSVLVLLSGGMDSATLLWLCKKQFDKTYAISFDYGQKHKVELKYAKVLALEAQVEKHFLAHIPFYQELGNNALTDKNIDVPAGEYPENEPPITTVPMRNLLFLSIAASFADVYQIDHIAIGVHSLDSPYPDCRPEFITSAEAAINASSVYVTKTKKRIHVYAPFLGMTKRDIAILGKDLGVPFERTYSCYVGTEPPCGKCHTCLQRHQALKGIVY